MNKIIFAIFEFLKIKTNIKNISAQILLDNEKEKSQYFGCKALVQAIAMIIFSAIGSLGLIIILKFSTINTQPDKFNFGSAGYVLGGFLCLFYIAMILVAPTVIQYMVAQFKQNKRAFTWISSIICSIIFLGSVALIVLACL